MSHEPSATLRSPYQRYPCTILNSIRSESPANTGGCILGAFFGMVSAMKALAIKRLRAGGVITNYHCVSRCGHCLYNCGPDRPKDYLDGALASKIFRDILDLGCPSVHIGGGEPMLNIPGLMEVLTAAGSMGMAIDYVETNSAWYVDAPQAEAVLNDLCAVGVKTLLVSISPFHNEFIPYDRVMGVIKACQRVGMAVFPWVNAFVKDLTRLNVQQRHSMAEFQGTFGQDYLARIPDRYWIHFGGRALKTFGTICAKQPAHRILESSPINCAGALSDTSHFHIDLYGHYIPGLCAGLAIGRDDLGNALPSGKYALLDRLAVEGIRGLFGLAEEQYGYVPQREGYLNHCDLCTEIREYLWGLEGEEFAELGPDGFYWTKYPGQIY